MNKVGKAIDKLMGNERVPSDPKDTRVQILLNAGISLLPDSPDYTLETPLQDLAEPEELQKVLSNLNALYIPGQNLSQDIINNISVQNLITHLDSALVENALRIMQRQEKAQVVQKTRNDLDELKNTLS